MLPHYIATVSPHLPLTDIVYCDSYVFPVGIKHEWQVNGLEDLKDRHTLAEKLGGSSVVSLEGSPI